MKAKSNPDDVRKGPTRLEKSKALPPHEHDGPGGRWEHDLWAVGGRVHELVTDDQGGEHYNRLCWRLFRRGPDGNAWHYHLVDIPCHVNGDHRAVPVHQGYDDKKAGFNRSEVLRKLPPTTDDYDHVYGYRPDAESLSARPRTASPSAASPPTAQPSRSSS